jgi:hypothetical protein
MAGCLDVKGIRLVSERRGGPASLRLRSLAWPSASPGASRTRLQRPTHDSGQDGFLFLSYGTLPMPASVIIRNASCATIYALRLLRGYRRLSLNETASSAPTLRCTWHSWLLDGGYMRRSKRFGHREHHNLHLVRGCSVGSPGGGTIGGMSGLKLLHFRRYFFRDRLRRR